MKAFSSLFLGLFYQLFKNVKWLINSFRITSGIKPDLEFPVAIEGKGRIRFGDNVRVGSRAKLAPAEGSNIRVGNRSKIGKNTQVVVSRHATFEMGDNSQILENTTCFIAADWNIGNNVKVATNCQIFSRENGVSGKLIIGNSTAISDYTIIDMADDVIIGNSVAIGSRCIIYTHDHDYRQDGIVAPWHGKPLTKPVTISDNAWIGSNVIIMPGVSIGSGAIVAAGSVVTKNVEPRVLYGGIPAKLIRKLD